MASIAQSPSSGSRVHAQLWREAYDCLDAGLKEKYEIVLKAELNVNVAVDIEEQAAVLLKARLQRVENRQWTYKWRGRPRKMRDQVATILDTVQKCAGVASVGINLAPIYVSLPWAAVTTLLPVSDIDLP